MTEMALWLLRPIEGWSPWYDTAAGFVVRASGEQAARLFASKEAGDEGRHVWLDPDKTTCVELTTDGSAGVVITDFKAA